jgi:hypothetical protein
MSSWKCSRCGLVNFATLEVCRRCQTSATDGYVAKQYPQGNFQANHSAPPQNYQTGNLPAQFPQAPVNNHRQSGNDSPANTYQQYSDAPGDAYSQGGDASQNNGYAGNHLYSQNGGHQPSQGYQQNSSGYAYNRGDTNGLQNPSQPYADYAQTDYSQAPSYGAPSMGAYQSSYPGGYGGQGAGVWREGDKLVMHKQAVLPDRCVKCNAPTNNEYLHRKLTWLHPAWLLLILASWLIYLIVYLVIRKKAEVDLGLCEQHRANRRAAITVGWVTALLGIGCFILAISSDTPGFIFLGILLFLFGLIFGSYAANVVSVTKMDDNYIWIKRVHRDYLANFPTTGGF